MMASFGSHGALDALVRRSDEDRWLASRFATRPNRERLIAIYAVSCEIARIGRLVREPALGALRLAWWRDALAEIHSGEPPRAHPALQAYAAHAHALPGEAWIELIEAETAFAMRDEAETAAARSAGAVLGLAMCACGAEASEALIQRGAAAWGLLRFMRSQAPPGSAADALARVTAAYRGVREAAREAPASLFPAIGYLALIPLYLGALRAGRSETPLPFRQLRLIAASATGRL